MTIGVEVSRIKVLLVEDNPGDARLIFELLRDVSTEAFDLDRVDRLAPALERLSRVGADVVLLDLGLPDSSGLETFEEMQRAVPREPIIVVSGLDNEQVAVAAVRAGAQDYLVKGRIEGALLAKVIRYAIERKRAEHEVTAREERFRALVEHSADAVALVDDNGIVTYASQSTDRVLGHGAEDVVGRSVLDFVHPDDVADVRRHISDLRARSGAVITIEARYLHKDASIRYAECSIANRLEHPAVQALVLNYRDITQRRGLEEQLRQAQKMEAVGRLAGGVAHDFNNLLTAIFGYVELLSEQLGRDSPAQQDVEEILKAATRAASLTRQLLAFSRQQVLDPVVLNLNEVVGDLQKMLHRLIGEDVELRSVRVPDLGNVLADAGQVEQVIMNLVVNARDAMPTGGTLTIETANVEFTEQFADAHQVMQPGAYVMLAVSDTGTGMTPEIRARIFEPFFTTKDKAKGTGLGLSTVFGIVKQSGGYIWTYSEPGQGTTFKLYFPRVDEPADVAERPHPITSAAGGTETVLLAEDDDLLRPLAHGVLTKLGYVVLEARNAQDAAARAAQHQGPIHLLVTDVVMPGASGRELARRLAEKRPEMRVLYMSGYTDDAIIRHGILERGVNYLQKPFTPAVLARRVRDVLDTPP
jgi:PAS domain S-box-containing protein